MGVRRAGDGGLGLSSVRLSPTVPLFLTSSYRRLLTTFGSSSLGYDWKEGSVTDREKGVESEERNRTGAARFVTRVSSL